MNKFSFLIIILVIFIAGWLSATVFNYYDVELFPELPEGGKKLTAPYFGIVGINAKELPSPADRVDESDIAVYPDKVVFEVEDPQWTGFYDTNSMDPLLDAEADVIEITPDSEADIQVGDIISYTAEDGGSVVHRVISIEEDEQGIYFIVKGDNNAVQDPENIRFDQIEGIVVAVFY